MLREISPLGNNILKYFHTFNCQENTTIVNRLQTKFWNTIPFLSIFTLLVLIHSLHVTGTIILFSIKCLPSCYNIYWVFSFSRYLAPKPIFSSIHRFTCGKPNHINVRSATNHLPTPATCRNIREFILASNRTSKWYHKYWNYKKLS